MTKWFLNFLCANVFFSIPDTCRWYVLVHSICTQLPDTCRWYVLVHSICTQLSVTCVLLWAFCLPRDHLRRGMNKLCKLYFKVAGIQGFSTVFHQLIRGFLPRDVLSGIYSFVNVLVSNTSRYMYVKTTVLVIHRIQ